MDRVQYARETLKGFAATIDKKLIQIRQDRTPQIIHHPIFQKSEKINAMWVQLMDHVMEHNARPAKRLRASLIYYGYKLIRWNNLTADEEKKLLYAAASIEFTHTGLLIHDDFQDRDSIRRWMPTTHKFFEGYHKLYCNTGDVEHFGASMAINCGDFALNLWNQTLLRSWFDPEVLLPALDILLEWVGQTIFGQSFDIILENNLIFAEQDVYDLHHGKTGIYTYLTPLLVGITLAWEVYSDRVESDRLQTKLMEYAIPCGIAFQLQDDVIGLFGDEEKTGKSAYSDIKEWKKTLLMLKTLELCSSHERDILQGLWWKQDLTNDQAELVRNVVRGCGALEYSYQKAAEYAKKAQKVVWELRAESEKLKANNGLELNESVLDYLEGIAEYMAIRRDA